MQYNKSTTVSVAVLSALLGVLTTSVLADTVVYRLIGGNSSDYPVLHISNSSLPEDAAPASLQHKPAQSESVNNFIQQYEKAPIATISISEPVADNCINLPKSPSPVDNWIFMYRSSNDYQNREQQLIRF
jgi:hypothetical protein